MEEALYDEFGNYIGPELDDDEDDLDEEEDTSWLNDLKPRDDADDEDVEIDHMDVEEENEPTSTSQSIVLHEDKKYYPSAEEVYGRNVETLVEDEDTQPLSEPVIQPIKEKKVGLEDTIPANTFSKEFLTGLLEHPALTRNIVLAGSLHHGKTTFMDMLVQQTHDKKWNLSKNIRYTDTLKLEQERLLSIKTTPMTLVLPNSSGKSFVVNIADTPGHMNFSDEVSTAIRISDGLVLVIDAVEGVTMQTKRILKHAVLERLTITVIINKMDRLLLELKLPPNDAYFKLKYIIDQVNSHLYEYQMEVQSNYNYNNNDDNDDNNNNQQKFIKVSPENGNVCFASSLNGWCFSLQSFAQGYSDTHGGFPYQKFAKRLWGNIWYIDGKFTRKSPPGGGDRTFISFILEPLYKLYSHTLSEEPSSLKKLLEPLGIYLTREQYKLDTLPLLKLVLSSFFGRACSFVDMIQDHIPSPVDAAHIKIPHIYTGPMNSNIAESMLRCDADGPLIIHISKLISNSEASSFYALGRVFSGTVNNNQRIKILGENYTIDDEEDMVIKEIESLYIPEARYRIPVESVGAGNWVLLEGIDDSIMKTATIVDASIDGSIMEDLYVFKPLKFNTISSVKLAVEPLNPSELPKMLEGLRKINKSYPLVTTRAEESGEHVILGTGELYLDCIMHDLRKVFSDIEVKVADPIVSFCETVTETSTIKCFAETPNKRNKITMIAEPLEKGIAEDIERNAVNLSWNKTKVAKFFQENYDWDLLAARNIWSFGPDISGPNVLLNDTLPTEVDRELLGNIKSSLIHGFQWGTRDGPLCEEPIRNVKFKLVDAKIASEPIHRSAGQLIPTARKVVYSSFLTATPRLMEPIYTIDIQTPEECIVSIYKVLGRRRGTVTNEFPIPGTPLFSVTAQIPVIESFGFETDLRTHTLGQSFGMSVFDHWQEVQGDPLNRKIHLRPLVPSPIPHLAREFMVKTRRRKGLSEDVSLNQFFDEQMLHYLKEEYGDVEGTIFDNY